MLEEIPFIYSLPLVKLIGEMLQKDTKLRPGIEQILKSEVFKDIQEA